MAASVGRRKSDENTFQVTPRGARLLKEAQYRRRNLITVEDVGRIAGVEKSTMSDILNGKQRTCRNLPAVCRKLGVNFYDTQPGLREDQSYLLGLLDKLRECGKEAVEAGIETFETHVAGVIARQERGSEPIRVIDGDREGHRPTRG